MRNKRKGILMAAAILGSAAIVSTGFAAWVVTLNNSTDVTGNIQVDAVDNQSISLSATVADPAIYFGPAEKSNKGGNFSWLTPDIETTCNLTAVINVNVTEGEDYCSGFTATIKECDASGNLIDDGPYAKAVAAKYVGELPTTYDVSYTTGETTGTVSFTFSWGEYFDFLNPTDFYSKYEHSAKRTGDTTYLQDALNVINSETFQNLNTAHFKVVVTPTRVQNNQG